jgi:beta-phosphoglucomutase
MFDTESVYKRAWQAAALGLGYELDDEFYSTLIGQTNPACEAIIATRFGSQFPISEFRVRWSRLWREDVELRGVAPKSGLTQLLTFLDEQGISTAVATSSDAEYTTLTLRMGGLASRFRHVVTGDQVAQGKPAPDIYLTAARRLAVAPQNCIAIEDSDAGVIAASSAGMLVMMVPDLKEPSHQAQLAAFKVLPSLIEVRAEIAALL